ncbi:MAG: hypothetical protein AAAB20_13045 [Rhizobium sp.]|jgi:hypothetical protein
MTDQKPRLVGLNHIALKLGDVEQALQVLPDAYLDFRLSAAQGMKMLL